MISEHNAKAREIADRAAKMAEVHAVENAPPDGQLPLGVQPTAKRADDTSRYVEVVFDTQGRFVCLLDEAGEAIEERWFDLPEHGQRRLRIRVQVAVESLMRGKAHAGAGDTERHAARKVNLSPGSDMRLTLDTFLADRAQGGNGLTDFELAELTKEDKNAIAPRRVDLMRAGWVEDAGVRRPSPKGNPSRVYRLTKRCLEELGVKDA